jgi:hypothetical protein
MTPVVELRQDKDRHDKILVGVTQQGRATPMVRVGCVKCRKQRTRVEHKSHL